LWASREFVIVYLVTVTEELPSTLTLIKGNNMKKKQLWIDLSDKQAEKVVGGVGIGASPGSSAGFAGWFGNGGPPMDDSDNGLFRAGKTPGNLGAGNSGNNIIIPT